MSDLSDEYNRYVARWKQTGDVARGALVQLFEKATASCEFGLEQNLVLLARGRDEARRLNEPWWVLLFEGQQLSALVGDIEDFARALPLAHELMVTFNSPGAQNHPQRVYVLLNVLCTYITIDPFGYQEEIERGLKYLDGQISQEPVSDRFVFNHRKGQYLRALERYAEAYELAQDSLSLAHRANWTWFLAWTLFNLCRICHAQQQTDEIAGHADYLEQLSKKHGNLRRTQADAMIWRAYTQRVRGDVKNASRSFQHGLRILESVDVRETICADPMAAYYEACGDIKAVLGVRDRELAKLTKNGELHGACLVQIDRCRLLAQTGELTASEFNAARLAANKLRVPQRFLEKIARLEQGG